MIYTQESVSQQKFIRTFPAQINSTELEWHRDRNDRLVKIIKGGGWKFQEEDELPISLTDGMELFIPRERFHRVIKGTDELIVEIEESNNE